jgi:hypothetical protein
MLGRRKAWGFTIRSVCIRSIFEEVLQQVEGADEELARHRLLEGVERRSRPSRRRRTRPAGEDHVQVRTHRRHVRPRPGDDIVDLDGGVGAPYGIRTRVTALRGPVCVTSPRIPLGRRPDGTSFFFGDPLRQKGFEPKDQNAKGRSRSTVGVVPDQLCGPRRRTIDGARWWTIEGARRWTVNRSLRRAFDWSGLLTF